MQNTWNFYIYENIVNISREYIYIYIYALCEGDHSSTNYKSFN